MSERPNIVCVVTTQWRAQALGVAGDPQAVTPHLDALASCSVNYRQAVTPHPFGPFARAALLTGEPSPANGVRDYFDPLPRERRTLAHQLGERGYDTGFIGKWHLARRDPAAPLVGETHARMRVPPAERGGFSHWEGFESGFLLNDPWLQGPGDGPPVRHSGYQSDVLVERALQWLEEREKARGPWVLVLSLEAPHPPYDAPVPAPVVRLAPAEVVLPPNVPRGGAVEERARRELAGYYAHLTATDRALGRLFERLPTEAVLVFTSVHGDMHGAHGRFRKGWPHEESVRVPLLVRGAPGGGPGTVNDETVSLVDLLPMMLAWADGRSWRCPRGSVEISMPSIVGLPHQCDRLWRGWRSPSRKRIELANGEPWLEFDLVNDPWEMRNLARPSPGVAPSP